MSDQSPSWLQVAGVLAPLGLAVLNIVLTLALTTMVHRFSKRSTELQILQRNSHQWQDLNIKIMENPRWQCLMEHDPAEATGADALLLKNMIFYVLNIVHEVFQAQRQKLIAPATAAPIIAGQIEALRAHAAMVEQLLALNRGYDPEFCHFVRTRLNRSPADDSVVS